MRLPTCVRSGATRPPAGVPRTVWHMTQGCDRKTCLPLLPLGIARRLGRPDLRIAPALELLLRLGDDEDAHMGVLEAAELGALAAVDARPVGDEPDVVLLAGDQVLLAHEVRDPEGVDHVGRHRA